MKNHKNLNMESPSNRIIRLHAKRLAGEILTDAERQLLRERYIQLGPTDDPAIYQPELLQLGWFIGRKSEAWITLEQRLFGNEPVDPQVPVIDGRSYMRPVVWLAAAILILILTARLLYLFLPASEGSKEVISVVQQSLPPAVSEDSRVTIILEDSTILPIDFAHKGVISTQGNTRVSIADNGQLIYKPGEPIPGKGEAYNIIQVPRGKQFTMVLPDGTKVSLNAASSLRFPVAFDGPQRQVELSGEATFNVRKNKAQPFIVKSGQMNVEVTGTVFNVKAYKDELDKAVTLFEGAVRVSTAGKTRQLQPLEQMVVSDTTMSLIQPVDSMEVMAWKQNLFHYNNRSLKTIMGEITRWYNVEIVYEGQNQEARFMMQHVPRNWSLEKVLSVLERTGDLRFKLEGNKITVLK